MAKILTGPLAAGISGKLGPVVFHQTKFGQVVQSKAKGRTYTTAPAVETKTTFAEAARMAGTMPATIWPFVDPPSNRAGKYGRGQFISSRMAATRGVMDQQMPCNGQTGEISPQLLLNNHTTIRIDATPALPAETATFEAHCFEFDGTLWNWTQVTAAAYGDLTIFLRQYPGSEARIWFWAVKDSPTVPAEGYRFGRQAWLDVPAA